MGCSSGMSPKAKDDVFTFSLAGVGDERKLQIIQVDILASESGHVHILSAASTQISVGTDFVLDPLTVRFGSSGM